VSAINLPKINSNKLYGFTLPSYYLFVKLNYNNHNYTTFNKKEQKINKLTIPTGGTPVSQSYSKEMQPRFFGIKSSVGVHRGNLPR